MANRLNSSVIEFVPRILKEATVLSKNSIVVCDGRDEIFTNSASRNPRKVSLLAA